METPVERDKIYFIILYQTKEKEKQDDLNFIESNKMMILPECIYTKEIKKADTYYYEKVCQVDAPIKKNKNPKKNTFNFEFEFEKGEEIYVISFSSKGNRFIYDTVLKIGKKTDLKKITKKTIDQNIIEYYKKLGIFRESLIKNKEENKIEELYKETIELYSEKKGFDFLISLFVELYQNKNLCFLLMEKFKEVNSNPKENEKNMDRKKSLEQYQQTFIKIASDADELIKKNDYKAENFYGIILCYLNYYDIKTFSIYVKKLFNENKSVLFEILITFNPHFKNPIEENLEFFINFINYTAKEKEYEIFESVLRYINDVETFLCVLDKNKKIIIEKYTDSKNINFKPIKLEKNLKLIKRGKNKEIENVIESINSIVEFSKESKNLLVYFTNNFWVNILSHYNEANSNSIEVISNLRKSFVGYYEVVNLIYKNKSKSIVQIEAKSYFERDEFAFLLDKIIKKYIDTNKELTN